MHRVTIAVIATLIAGTRTPMMAQNHDHHQPIEGGGVFPTGWSGRPDPNGGTVEDIKLVSMGKNYHLTTGTSSIVYRQADATKGPFHAMATLTQTKASGEHPEGYGLFFGGRNLDSVSQRYVYFLVRGDGQYLIKRRVGEEVTEVTPWTEHKAIKRLDAKDQATNAIAIQAKANKAVFTVNGQAVDSMAITADDLKGVVGIRANHDLDLHIADFMIH